MTNYEHADAPDNVELYLTKSIGVIDKAFGKGYAKANPALVAAFITACEQDHNTDATAIQQLAESRREEKSLPRRAMRSPQ